MKIFARCLKTVVLPLMLLLTGCVASFQGNQLDPVKSYPIVSQQKSIYAKLAYTAKLNGKDWPKNNAQNEAYLKNRLMNELESSDMFSLISDELYTTDLRLYVAIVDEKDTRSSSKFLAVLTSFIIPYTTTDTFRLIAIVKEPSTGREAKISLTDHVSHRQHLLMFPFTPFKSSGSELAKCTDRLLENLCLEIQRTGMVK